VVLNSLCNKLPFQLNICLGSIKPFRRGHNMISYIESKIMDSDQLNFVVSNAARGW
jgi:hypothetical protein